jgi:Tol biopolymer transport system component
MYTMNSVDGGDKENLTDANPGGDVEPAWAPFNDQIAFASVADGATNSNIYVMNSDGGGRRALDTATANDISPDWQPIRAAIRYRALRATTSSAAWVAATP